MERLDESGRAGNSTGTLPTAGAIAVTNAKGEITLQKVKVTRYVAGQRPAFADSDSDSEDERRRRRREQRQRREHVVKEDIKEIFERPQAPSGNDRRERDDEDDIKQEPEDEQSTSRDDRRLARLSNDDRRRAGSPSVVKASRNERRAAASSSSDSSEEEGDNDVERHAAPKAPHRPVASDDSDNDDEAIARRRAAMRAKALAKQEAQQELLAKEEPKEESESEEESSDEYTDSDDDAAPRLKPVFVRKRDRITLQESEKERKRMEELQLDEKKAMDIRKKDSQKIVETLVKREIEQESMAKKDTYDLDSINTDDDDEEIAYDEWKVRELTRIKRVKDDAEQRLFERAEIERVHNMTEEERKEYVRQNPRVVTNKQEKGKYKFMQKYFHRGVFYLDEDDEVYQRNFAEATLEDRFDKSVLPKVMQVKDFGKQGRTKWTHLVAEDTTDYTNAWAEDSAANLKFYKDHGGGLSESMTRPAAKKQRTT